MIVLGYNQFGGVGEEAYISYLRVTALSLLRDGSAAEGRSLVAAANKIVGCDLGRAVIEEVAGGGYGDVVVGGDERGLESSYDRRVCCESCKVLNRTEGVGCSRNASTGMVFEDFARSGERVESVKGSQFGRIESSGNVREIGVCFECGVSLSRIGGCDCVVKLKDQRFGESCVFSTAETKLERNRRWREEKKQKKKQRQFLNKDWRRRPFAQSGSLPGSSSLDQSSFSETSGSERLKDDGPKVLELRATLEEKWKVQNQLATERAKRELEVLRATDIEQEVKQYRTKVSAATERNMVSIERTHAKLRETGNLPQERGGGFAETVVSSGQSGTISPDSSASMAEFRACQKALLDAEAKNVEYERKIKIASEKYGFPLEQVDFLDKEVWTDTQTNQDILDEIYPNGYGKDTSLFEDGKFRAIGV